MAQVEWQIHGDETLAAYLPDKAFRGILEQRIAVAPDLAAILIRDGQLVDTFQGAHFSVFLHEFRHFPIKHPDHIVNNEHLSVAIRPRSDSERWDPRPLGDDGRHFRRHGLQKNTASARFLKNLGVFNKLLGCADVTPLRLVSSQLCDRLGG